MTLYEELLKIAKDNIEGMTYDEALYWLDNDAIPSIGSVSGLIYYHETEPLACRHHDEIMEMIKEVKLMKEADIVNAPMTLNDMAWFAWNYLILCNGERVLEDLGWEPAEEEK